jgi:hypothetical protein
MGKLTDRSLAPFVNLNSLIHIVNTGDTSQSPDGSSYKTPLSDLSALFTDAVVTGFTFNNFNYDLSIELSDNSVYTQNLAILASDIKVTGGTYDSNTGEITFINNSGGTFIVSGIDIYEFTGNTSATCINDIYVSNIHSCSPLNINPLDEGNVYLGSTSGITFDILNKRIGIGTSTPTQALDIVGTGGTWSRITSNLYSYYQLNAPGSSITLGNEGAGFRNLVVQGGTDFFFGDDFNGSSVYTKYNITTGNWLFGKKGYIFSRPTTSKVNIVADNNLSTDSALEVNNTTDQITGTESSLFKIFNDGKIGINNPNPTEKLDVSGKTKTTNFQMTSGATNGYVLKSDNLGNANWKLENYITGFTFNLSNYELTLDDSNNNSSSVDLSILSSDIRVTGGTYNPSNGIATFSNNSGGTFQVSGFLTGMTDFYTTGATLNGTVLEFDRNDLLNAYSVDLSVLSGPTKYSASIPFTGGTAQTVTHNLNDGDVIVQLKDSTGKLIIPDEVDNYTLNTVDIRVSSTETYRVIIIG